MALFSYRAIDDDGKEVRGSIEATDLDAATRAIEDLHIEVVEVHEASRSQHVDPLASSVDSGGHEKMFAFEGTDLSGTVRRGTIHAPTKITAFQKLRNDQKLTLKMLAPMGTLPAYNDSDLDAWQKAEAKATPIQPVNTTAPTQKTTSTDLKPRPSISFTSPTVSVSQALPTSQEPTKPVHSFGYHSIVTTLRLYAGWLLAWYGLFVAVGYYATTRSLPWDIPFVQAFYVSPLIFTFTVSIFLFLILSEVHRLLRGKLILGAILTLLGIGLVVIVRSTF